MISHRKSSTRIYFKWQDIKGRCLNKNRDSYKYYGGRGIKVCDRWINSFENFYEDMKDGYRDNFSLDRIDNDGDYEPGNCRWVEWKDQCVNKSNSRKLTLKGKTQTIAEWAREIRVSRHTLYWRANKGLSTDEILKH